eukprot:1156869-Pelagomonas_calceolata.AAC.5
MFGQACRRLRNQQQTFKADNCAAHNTTASSAHVLQPVTDRTWAATPASQEHNRLQQQNPPLFKACDIDQDVADMLVRIFNIWRPIYPRNYKALQQHSPAREAAAQHLYIYGLSCAYLYVSEDQLLQQVGDGMLCRDRLQESHTSQKQSRQAVSTIILV